jgi:hypothetical protein
MRTMYTAHDVIAELAHLDYHSFFMVRIMYTEQAIIVARIRRSALVGEFGDTVNATRYHEAHREQWD